MPPFIYVSLVGMVVAQASAPGHRWRFIVLDTDGVNAFAPGGFIHTRGALALLTNEMELAGMLAHGGARHGSARLRPSVGRMKDLGLGLLERPDQAALNRLAEKPAASSTQNAGEGTGRIASAPCSPTGWLRPEGLGSFLARLDRNRAPPSKACSPRTQNASVEARQADRRPEAAAPCWPIAAKVHRLPPTPQTEIAQVAEGTAGLAGAAKAGEKKTVEQDTPKKKRGFGLANLVRPGGEEKKSAQVTGSGGSRGVDTERNAKGGENPALVAMTLTRATSTGSSRKKLR
jgi:hypothetical protein